MFEMSESILSSIVVFLVGIVTGVISLLIGEELLRRFRKPKMVIETIRKGDKIGFSVRVKRKTVKNAQVQCNNIIYSWNKGKEHIERKNLYVGDSPSTFFPFQVNVEYTDNLLECPVVWVPDNTEEFTGGILITVKEIETKKIVYNLMHAIPANTKRMRVYCPYTEKPAFTASIRIIGEGIEEEKDYLLTVGLNNLHVPVIKEGKPLMEFVDWGFEIKKAK